ncbi:phosphate ABC transporter permease PstA [Acidiferrimicrobium sp. IK]|uniref:phosphate ABC transporter permease PstA n=1 Tax=Acidiferrimicrobium sp. IK TaxID=2871700 RepID=UPI0021CB2517|nr:phosphate ABC transporter permease PstA [Acidiferrimicrobium sp. IK]MCU4185095.1 phosphate ABC transporter permease PstA [Acidiferrimicrobium sp. IK]
MRARGIRDLIFWGLCALAFVLIVAPAMSVIISVFHQAAPAFGWSLFTKPTHGDHGGLSNAIVGTLLLLLGVLVVAGTIGVAAGIYLAEFAGPRLGGILRFFSEVLAGMPSIVIGYVGYIALVVEFHWGYSLLAGLLALSVLVLPYVVKTTEVALRQVPTTLREASAGLGLPRGRTVARILLPPAIPGIVSGLIVALAISTGETAPLLFTAGFLDGHNPGLNLFHHQVPYLTYVTFTDTSLPGQSAHQLAAAAGAVTLIILIVLIALGRVVAGRARKQTERMSL